MGKCKNETIFNKVKTNKISVKDEIDFNVLTDLDTCVKIHTHNYANLIGADNAVYNWFKRPDDVFNCLADGCANSGTLQINGGAGTEVGAVFKVLADATDFYAGVVPYYLELPVADDYEVTTTFYDILDTTKTNTDVYKQSIHAVRKQFVPVIIDLTVAPTETTGDGWKASEKGAVVEITVKPKTDTTVSNVGISSIAFYEALSDFEVNDVVKLGCIDEISGSFDVDATDATCFGSEYDPDSVAIERTITAKAITPNDWKLNPLESRGEHTVGSMIVSVNETIQEKVIDGVRYGYVQVVDMYEEECGFTSAQVDEKCNVTDCMLSRVSSPIPVKIQLNQFQVLNSQYTSEDEAGLMLFSEELIGEEVNISYPRTVEVVEYRGNTENLEGKRVRMSFVKCVNDKVKYRIVFNKVLITSFPDTINKEETTYEFTVAIHKDSDGDFYKKYRIKD